MKRASLFSAAKLKTEHQAIQAHLGTLDISTPRRQSSATHAELRLLASMRRMGASISGVDLDGKGGLEQLCQSTSRMLQIVLGGYFEEEPLLATPQWSIYLREHEAHLVVWRQCRSKYIDCGPSDAPILSREACAELLQPTMMALNLLFALLRRGEWEAPHTEDENVDLDAEVEANMRFTPRRLTIRWVLDLLLMMIQVGAVHMTTLASVFVGFLPPVGALVYAHTLLEGLASLQEYRPRIQVRQRGSLGGPPRVADDLCVSLDDLMQEQHHVHAARDVLEEKYIQQLTLSALFSSLMNNDWTSTEYDVFSSRVRGAHPCVWGYSRSLRHMCAAVVEKRVVFEPLHPTQVKGVVGERMDFSLADRRVALYRLASRVQLACCQCMLMVVQSVDPSSACAEKLDDLQRDVLLFAYLTRLFRGLCAASFAMEVETALVELLKEAAQHLETCAGRNPLDGEVPPLDSTIEDREVHEHVWCCAPLASDVLEDARIQGAPWDLPMPHAANVEHIQSGKWRLSGGLTRLLP